MPRYIIETKEEINFCNRCPINPEYYNCGINAHKCPLSKVDEVTINGLSIYYKPNSNNGSDLPKLDIKSMTGYYYLCPWDSSKGKPVNRYFSDGYVFHNGDYFIITNIAKGKDEHNLRPISSYVEDGNLLTDYEDNYIAEGMCYIYSGHEWILSSYSVEYR